MRKGIFPDPGINFESDSTFLRTWIIIRLKYVGEALVMLKLK